MRAVTATHLVENCVRKSVQSKKSHRDHKKNRTRVEHGLETCQTQGDVAVVFVGAHPLFHTKLHFHELKSVSKGGHYLVISPGQLRFFG